VKELLQELCFLTAQDNSLDNTFTVEIQEFKNLFKHNLRTICSAILNIDVPYQADSRSDAVIEQLVRKIQGATQENLVM